MQQTRRTGTTTQRTIRVNGSGSARGSETMVVAKANCMTSIFLILLIDFAKWLLALGEEHFFSCFYLQLIQRLRKDIILL